MNVAIVGFGIEGQAAYAHWSQLGADITICDQDPYKQIPPDAASQLGDNYLEGLDRFDLIFRTNGLNPDVLLRDNPGIGDKVTTSLNEFMRVAPTKHIIGVTGTKGKGTTSTLITKMLEAAGKEVFLGGNIGVSLLTVLPKLTADSWVVAELSSYQLVDFRYSPPIAVCLMVVPEHLNWHGDMESYILAKARLFEHQTTEDLAIYYANNDTSRRIASYGQGRKLPYFAEPGAYVKDGSIVISGERICDTDELKLLGEHNWQNACAAVTAVWQVTQNMQAIRSVLTTFAGLPHRLESIRSVNGVTYFNDSFASTPDAAIASLEAIREPKVIILGGFDRKLPLDHLARALADNHDAIRKAVIIGASGVRLAGELEKAGFTNYVIEQARDMPAIVKTAQSYTRQGDAVLLSPGFASFDMFKNFEDRGNQFRTVVEKL